MTEKRFVLVKCVEHYWGIVDKSLESIDQLVLMHMNKTSVSYIVNVLNQLTEENEQLKREKKRYKQLSEIRAENVNNRILSIKEFINNCEDEKVKNALEDLFYSEVKEYDLAKENRELKAEKEFWKGAACNCSNYLSILSMDCQIVQEAICNLKNVIDVDTEAFKLLDELDDKFDELNQHRIKMYRR